MIDRVVDRLLRDAEQRDADRRVKCVEGAIGVIAQGPARRLTRIADRAVKMVFHRLGKAEQMQHRGLGLLDDLAQILHAKLQSARHRFQRFGRYRAATAQPFQPPRQPGKVGQGLVVQIHADALALALQRFGQLQRALPQPFLAGAGLGFHDRRLLRLLGRPQREEIRRQQVGDITRVAHIGVGVAPGPQQRTTERPDDLAMHHHRHMNPAAQRMFEDRLVKRTFELEPRVGACVIGQDVVNLALQQGADRAVGHRRQRLAAPIGFDAGLVGGVKLGITAHDADIKMVVRQDTGNLGGHRADRRAEIKLPGQQPRDSEKVVQQRCWGDIDHLRRAFPGAGRNGAKPCQHHARQRASHLRHPAQSSCGFQQPVWGFPQMACLFGPIQTPRCISF